MADAGFDLQIEKYAKRTNREPFGLPEGSFPLSEQAVMNLFDCIQQQLTLEKIDLGSAYLAIPLDYSARSFDQTDRRRSDNFSWAYQK